MSFSFDILRAPQKSFRYKTHNLMAQVRYLDFLLLLKKLMGSKNLSLKIDGTYPNPCLCYHWDLNWPTYKQTGRGKFLKCYYRFNMWLDFNCIGTIYMWAYCENFIIHDFWILKSNNSIHHCWIFFFFTSHNLKIDLFWERNRHFKDSCPKIWNLRNFSVLSFR